MTTTSLTSEPPKRTDRAASPWLVVATALFSGVVVGFTSWLAVDYSNGVRALAAVAGLGLALAIMLFIAWALDGEKSSEAVAAPSAGAAASPTARPTAAPDAVFAPTMSTAAAPSSDVARDALTRRLEEGLVRCARSSSRARSMLESAPGSRASDARSNSTSLGLSATSTHSARAGIRMTATGWTRTSAGLRSSSANSFQPSPAEPATANGSSASRRSRPS